MARGLSTDATMLALRKIRSLRELQVRLRIGRTCRHKKTAPSQVRFLDYLEVSG